MKDGKQPWVNQIGYKAMTVSYRLRILSGLFCLFLLPLPVSAEYVYVDDTLRVGVRPEPESEIGPVNVVMTGMKLEVLERRDSYVKIRTEKGVEGWIKDIYVSEKVPAKIELVNLGKQYQKLVAEAEAGNERLKEFEEKNNNLTQEIKQLKSSNSELQQRLSKSEHEHGTGDSGLLYVWLVLAVILTGLLAFYAGVFWHRKQAMKRLGGLRF